MDSAGRCDIETTGELVFVTACVRELRIASMECSADETKIVRK